MPTFPRTGWSTVCPSGTVPSSTRDSGHLLKDRTGQYTQNLDPSPVLEVKNTPGEINRPLMIDITLRSSLPRPVGITAVLKDTVPRNHTR